MAGQRARRVDCGGPVSRRRNLRELRQDDRFHAVGRACRTATRDDHGEGLIRDSRSAGQSLTDRGLTALSGIGSPPGETVYCYVVRTMSHEDGSLYHQGSGPNLQGSRFTLCSCKWDMRALLGRNEWKGKWIAGFTSVDTIANRGERGNYLAYLMRVENTFTSHHDLWNHLNAEDRAIKSTRTNPYGDVYEPYPTLHDPFDPDQYFEPDDHHSHWGYDPAYGYVWRKDIRHKRKGLPSVLLAGDPRQSFLWTRPLIYTTLFVKDNAFRGHRVKSWSQFLDLLTEVRR